MTVEIALIIKRGLLSARPAAGNNGARYFATDTGLVYFDNGASWDTWTPAGFVTPMTTQDDLIVGGVSGVAARLAKGTDSQVLTVDPATHHLVWATPFTNPMTTAGDLIVGGVSGTPTRLAGSGTDGFVATYDSASTPKVKWAATASASALLEIHTHISSAQILTLHSSPVTLLAGVANKVYSGVYARLVYNFGTTPYTLSAGNLGISRGSAGNVLFGFDNQILTESFGNIAEVPFLDPGGYQFLPDISGNPNGTLKLYSQNVTNPSAGDGTLDVYVLYTSTTF